MTNRLASETIKKFWRTIGSVAALSTMLWTPDCVPDVFIGEPPVGAAKSRCVVPPEEDTGVM
jgi:hypothetical protein